MTTNETKNYFTPFIFDPLRIDMNTVHSLSTLTPTPNFLLEHIYNIIIIINLILYYNIVLDYYCERDKAVEVFTGNGGFR